MNICSIKDTDSEGLWAVNFRPNVLKSLLAYNWCVNLLPSGKPHKAQNLRFCYDLTG